MCTQFSHAEMLVQGGCGSLLTKDILLLLTIKEINWNDERTGKNRQYRITRQNCIYF